MEVLLYGVRSAISIQKVALTISRTQFCNHRRSS